MTQKMTLKVTGMSCSHCERRVNAALTALGGVSSSKADAKTGAVEIEYDPQVVGKADLLAAIEDAGYGAEG